MKNFDWTKFTRRIAIKTKVEDVYNAWTTTSELEKWFLKKAIFSDEKSQLIDGTKNIEKGYTYRWSWYLFDIVEEGTITEANGKNFIQFTFAGECLVDINLSERDEHVIVELTQKNIPEDDDSKVQIRLGCDSGWSFFLLNLKSFYENGADLRNRNPDFKGMVNN